MKFLVLLCCMWWNFVPTWGEWYGGVRWGVLEEVMWFSHLEWNMWNTLFTKLFSRWKNVSSKTLKIEKSVFQKKSRKAGYIFAKALAHILWICTDASPQWICLRYVWMEEDKKRRKKSLKFWPWNYLISMVFFNITKANLLPESGASSMVCHQVYP